MKNLIVFVIILLVSGFSVADEIKIGTENFPQFNYINENKEVVGTSTEVVKKVLKELNIDAKILVYPWSRVYSSALKEKNFLIYSLARTEKREKIFKWIGVVSPYKVSIFKLSKNSHIEINKIEDLKKYKISAVQNDVKAQYLIDKGIDVSFISKEKFSIKKVLNERDDLLIYDELSFEHQLKEMNVSENKFKKAFFVEEISGDLYMAFSISTDDKIVNQFKEALKKVLNDK